MAVKPSQHGSLDRSGAVESQHLLFLGFDYELNERTATFERKAEQMNSSIGFLLNESK